MYGKTKMLLIFQFLIFNPHDYSYNAFIGFELLPSHLEDNCHDHPTFGRVVKRGTLLKENV